MYDAVNALAIPESANAENVIVAGYINGKYAWSASDWARFPKAVRLRIDVLGNDPLGSDILDVEPGNLGTPIISPGMSLEEVEHIWELLCDAAATWVETRHSKGIQSTCYVQESRKNQLANKLQGKSLFFMAQWGIKQSEAEALLRGAECAIQFENTPGYDVSVALDNWHPAPSAAPKPPAEPEAPYITGATIGTELDGNALKVTLTLKYNNNKEKVEVY